MKRNEKPLEENKTLDEELDEHVDVNSKEVVVERVEHGLIGSLRIEDEINAPFFKANDLAFIRHPSKLEKKDYVLYKDHDDYFLRRVMKYNENGIYVAGDNEKSYHLIEKESIIGKVIGRQRKNKFKSINLKPSISLDIYTLVKYNLAYFRLKNRVIAYEDDINTEAFEIAKERFETVNENKASTPVVIQQDIEKELDSELNYFINPDDLVIELQKEMQAEAIRQENEKIEKERKLEEARRMVEEYDENNSSDEEYEDKDELEEDSNETIDVEEIEE